MRTVKRWGFEDDDDRIIDPDIVPNLKIAFVEIQELDIDHIIENVEYDAIVSQQPAIATSHHHNIFATRKFFLYVVKVEKKLKEINEPQLRFTGDEMVPQEFLELDTPF